MHFSCSCSAALRSIYRICFGTPAIPYEKSGFIMRPWQHLPNTSKAQALSPSVRHRYQRLTGRLLRKNATRNSRNSHSNTGPWSTKHWPHQRLEALGSCHPKVDGFPMFFTIIYTATLVENTSKHHQGARPPVQPMQPWDPVVKKSTFWGDPLFFTKPKWAEIPHSPFIISTAETTPGNLGCRGLK